MNKASGNIIILYIAMLPVKYRNLIGYKTIN